MRECCRMRILYKGLRVRWVIYRTLSFRTAPSFPTVPHPCKLDCKARVEQGRIPKALASKTVPPVAKCSPASKIALPVRPTQNRGWTRRRNTLFVQVRQYAASKRGRRRKSGLVPAICGVRLTDFGFLSLECGTRVRNGLVLA